MLYFASLSMKKMHQPYSVFQSVSAILMIFTLIWLTISTPFVFEHQQKIAKQINPVTAEIPANNTNEESGPLGNTTEEKAPGNAGLFSEEYLHEYHNSDHYFLIGARFHKFYDAGTYIAFHGEMLVPPPNQA